MPRRFLMHFRRPARPYTLLSILLCCRLLVVPSVSALQGGGANASRGTNGSASTKGAPGKNLPNLDDVRRRGPSHPKALPPIPSRHKKCPPDDPGCNRHDRVRDDATVGAPSTSAAEPPSARVMLGALVASALNPYGGVSLASTAWGVPEPPPVKDRDARDAASAGWLSNLTGKLWAGLAPLRTVHGVFEYAGCDAVSGWAWDDAQPNTPIMVSLFSDGQLVGTVLADQYRADITAGDSRHGFRMALPDSLRDGASHSLSVMIQVEGADISLDSSPKTLTCSEPSYEGAITSADCDQITGWAWDSGRPSTPIDVDLYVDGGFVARESADTYDATLNKGDNRHRFRLATPAVARDGQAHAITIRPAGSTQALGSPASVTCNGPSYQGYLDYADCNIIAGWVVDWNKLNTPVSVDIYSDGTFVTRVMADNFRQDIANLANDNGRHGFVVQTPDSLRDGVAHYLTAKPTGSASQLTTIPGAITCSARAGCAAAQGLPSTEFVKDFYMGALARQPRPLELQYWNDALRTAAAQSQDALQEKAKLLGRELFLEGEYAGRGRMAAGHESEYVSDLYWAYLQRGPEAGGQSYWVGSIQSQNSQGQNGWMGALSGFESSDEFTTRVAAVCPSPADSVRNYNAATDFSPLQNADGAWAYGYKTTSTSAFALYPAHVLTTSPPPSYDTWYQPAITDPYLTPLVRHVADSQTLLMHPGPQGQQSVVRWTAAAAMSVIISGSFSAASTTTTDVHVRLNSSTALFDGNINGSGSAAPFSLTRTVAAGDTIEFVVGYGSNGNYNSDATTLAVTFSQPPPAQTQPYNGTAAQIPSTLEAELFDAGGEGVAYHDMSAGSHGNDWESPPPYPPPPFRQPTDVDIYKHSGYSNGYLVVMQAGDWMNYTVDVAQAGSYTLSAVTSYWHTAGGVFHVEVDGADITGPMQLGGNVWQTLTKSGVQLNAGRHVLRIVCDSNGTDNVYMGSLDYLRLTLDEDANLVARWKFDEGSGATASDSTGYSSTGTLGGGASWSSGLIGTGALNFNGTGNYVSVPSPSSALSSVSNNFTISFWDSPRSAHEIDPEGTTGVAGISGQRYVFGPTVSGVSTESGAGVSVGTNGVSVYEHSGGYMPATLVYQGAVNGWTHVAVVYENRQPRLYLNGQLVRIGYTSPKAVVRAIPWNLGGNSYGYFDGQVDDVRVYGRVLSAGEIGALVSAGGVDPTGNAFSEAEKDPANQTGSGGDDPLSRNFNFSVPLVGLKGRAGLDLGLSLSYNSLVWTRDAATGAVKFDSDYGDPSPGFRFGLPVIHRRYRNARGENAYLLVTPSGAGVELRQLGTSNTYEATDSSYTQLTEDNGLTLRPADGSQISFTLKGYEFRCTKIKDSNGNFITVSYNAVGNVSSVTDTLGRIITFTYDANNRPLSIEQNRGGQTHQWATFGYASLTMNAAFAGGVTRVGPSNGTAISALSRVSLDDGSFYNFLYNSWGQVYRVERRASDGSAQGRLLSYQEYDLSTPAAAQTNNGTDCPRFTLRKDFIKDWNNDQPVYTTYSTGTGGVQTVKNNQVLNGSQVADTSDTVTQEITYGASNTWRRGLVTQAKTYWQGTLRRTAQTTWTQDDESLPYELNPRVKVSEVSDPQSNHTGTTVEYTSYGLPTDIYEWNGTASNVLRRTHTEYNLDPAYVGRRVIGLVSSKSLYDELGRVASKVDYTYDQGGQFLQHQGEPVQHDAANYGAGFVSGRGLMTSVRRWDVTALHDVTKSVESRVGYNTTGSAVFSRDPMGHQSSVAYADRFTDASGTNTLAYATSATDAGSFSSKVEYSYYTGQVMRKEDPKGAQQTFTYDAAGRAVRVEASGKGANGAVISGGYTRWVYSDSMDAVQSWTQVDAGKAESCAISVMDGAGRARASATDLPGSAGGYGAQYVTYDIAGRVSAQTRPTEANGLWTPAGADAAGWDWTTTSYDWKARPLLVTNPGSPATTKEFLYGGCGCAGGDVTVVRDEVGRRQKLTRDALGRTVKMQDLSIQSKSVALSYLADESDVYRTALISYNVLDQEAETQALVGKAETDPNKIQKTTNTYDGHGRLKTKHVPMQAAGTFTAYTYNADDTVETVTDARGARATHHYNSRHLVEDVSFDGSTAGVPSVSVNYDYDEAGNRVLMEDGGSTTYTYDVFSRLKSETRTFAGLTGSFPVTYEYTLRGQLKRLADSFGAAVNYDYDSAGRVRTVTNTGFANASNVSSYATGMQYRAWGGLKQFNFGTNSTHSLAITYDERMRVRTYHVNYSGPFSNYTDGVDIDYYDDGRLKFAHQLRDIRHDRSFAYNDPAGRLTQELAGEEARGVSITTLAQRDAVPFRQDFEYDAWDNPARVAGWHWSKSLTTLTPTYFKGRDTSFTYDAEGNVLQENGRTYTYDAAGRVLSVTEPPRRTGRPSTSTTYAYDGDGQQVKSNLNGTIKYYLLSSFLRGQHLTNLGPQGQKATGYVYVNGTLLAQQNQGATQAESSVSWVHKSPDASGEWTTVSMGWGESLSRTLQLDMLGRDMGLDNPYEAGGDGLGSYPLHGDVGGSNMACALDGSVTNCGPIFKIVGRDPAWFIYMIISFRVGQSMPFYRTDEIYKPTSIDGGTVDNPDNDPRGVGYTHTVYAAPDPFALTFVGYEKVWISNQPLIPLMSLVPPTVVVPVQKNLRDDVMKLLMTGNCLDFTNRLLQELNKRYNPDKVEQLTSIIDGIDMVMQQGGFQFGSGINTVGGDLFGFKNKVPGAEPGTVLLTPWHAVIPPTRRDLANAYGNYTFSAIHETFHLAKANGFSDEQLARAAHAIDKTAPPNFSSDEPFSWSGAFDTVLEKYCQKQGAGNVH